MMRIQPLGTGSAFCHPSKNFQTNLIVESNNKRMLIDAGTTLYPALTRKQLSLKDFEALYLTHPHADHIGGVEMVAFMTCFIPNLQKLTLFCDKDLLHNLWENSLSGGLKTLDKKQTDINDYFNIGQIGDNHCFSWESLRFHVIPNIHVQCGDFDMNTYSLMVENTKTSKKAYITSDVRFNPNNVTMFFYRQADIIIHDCETTPFQQRSAVHSHYEELQTLPDDIKQKMWLIHYSDNVVDDFKHWQSDAVGKHGFLGFITKDDVIEM